MPELPEVENVRNTLIPYVVGHTITGVTIHYGKLIKKPVEVEQFQDALKGETCIDVHRRGKFLLFETTHYTLLSHLRMEGKYKVVNEGECGDKHTHVEFHLDNGTKLLYNDVRKFGTFHLYKKGDEWKEGPLLKLGIEPFDEEWPQFNLFERLQRTGRPIKNVLLDQSIVTGLGNIYVDEALFRSRILPTRPANMVTEEESVALKEAIHDVLYEAVEKGGSTIRSYKNTQGKEGSFQKQLFVYGRKGEPCLVCGHTIEKIQLGGRGTHYCPICQK